MKNLFNLAKGRGCLVDFHLARVVLDQMHGPDEIVPRNIHNTLGLN